MSDQTVEAQSPREALTGARVPLAALAAGAAVVHLAMVPSHAEEWWPLGAAFVAVGWLQLALALVLLAHPRRWTVAAGVALNAATAVAWAWTRTVGWPVGPDAGTTEALGFVDAVCAGFEISFVAFGAVLLVRPRALQSLVRRVALASAVPVVAVAGLTTAALASPSAVHDHGHDEAHAESGDDELADSSHGQHTDGGGDEHASGAGHQHAECTAPVTAEQQAAADELAAATRADVTRFDDVAAAEAAGYRAITPADLPIIHYASPAYLVDGALLDPERPESLVYAHGETSDRWYLLGVMYMMDDPAATPPQPGGCLTQWHAHTNLCLEPGVGMVATVDAVGNCPAGSVNETTPSMMHVWTIDLPTGPFGELGDVSRPELIAAILSRR